MKHLEKNILQKMPCESKERQQTARELRRKNLKPYLSSGTTRTGLDWRKMIWGKKRLVLLSIKFSIVLTPERYIGCLKSIYYINKNIFLCLKLRKYDNSILIFDGTCQAFFRFQWLLWEALNDTFMIRFSSFASLLHRWLH